MATFIFPTVRRITSQFSASRKHPVTGVISYHSGTDFAEPGYHEIKASAGGKVVVAGDRGTYGQCVMIEHNINGDLWTTVYAHLRAGSVRVKVGQNVKQAQVIGIMGATGRVTGQHLHFELHRGKWNSARSNAVNPMGYLGKSLTPKLAVDGRWGPATTRALQLHFGTTVDGVISGQPKNRSTQNIPSAEYGTGGSDLIAAMQRYYKSGIVDRKISGTSNLIRAMQRKYGLKIVDGYVSHTSNLVKEIQKRLNNGTL